MSRTTIVRHVRRRPGNMRATRVQIDGIWFDSTVEGKRYKELRLMQTIGEITELEWQVVYYLWAGIPPTPGSDRPPQAVRLPKGMQFRLDFRYWHVATSTRRHEDIKGRRDPKDPVYRMFRLKKRLVETTYNITILEGVVRRGVLCFPSAT